MENATASELKELHLENEAIEPQDQTIVDESGPTENKKKKNKKKKRRRAM